jgi:hypothetical protein
MSISITDELYEKVKHIVPAKKISKFVTLAISKELDAKEEALRNAYIAAEHETQRQEELQEWDDLDVNG